MAYIEKIEMLPIKNGNKDNFLGNKDNFLDGIDVVYWINLERATKRHCNMIEVFKDPVFKNIPNIRIEAFDGNLPSTIFSKIKNYDRTRFTDLEYGCTLSHLECIRQFYYSDYNIALILEDDATLEYKPYWRKSIAQLMNDAPSNWEVIQIASISQPNNLIYTNWHDKISYSTLAYIINKKGAKKIIEPIYNPKKDIFELKSQIHIADTYMYINTNTYTFKYPFFTYPSNNDSTIHSDHLDGHFYTKSLFDSLMMS
jgi:GR25 family glycosyltransferase involved in LPS biosynthesis